MSYYFGLTEFENITATSKVSSDFFLRMSYYTALEKKQTIFLIVNKISRKQNDHL